MSHVRIRMYRQGLGDCFLLSFPAARKRPFHMLVDCGVLKGTENGQERIREVAADVLKTTNKQLDVLVVTHEHWDHISGFAQAQEIFDRLSIGCVWAGWTENESTEAAKLLRKKREKAKKALRTAAKRLRGLGTEAAATSARRVNHLLGFLVIWGSPAEPAPMRQCNGPSKARNVTYASAIREKSPSACRA